MNDLGPVTAMSCPMCDGEGVVEGYEWRGSCPECGGVGLVDYEEGEPYDYGDNPSTFDTCLGDRAINPGAYGDPYG